MATEQLEGKGLIVVSGAAFMSNFEVQAQLDNGAEKNYSNYRICENLIKYLNPIKVTPISEVQKQTEKGYKFTIEGIVTSNASGYDKNTAFFDCIYVQDTTGGINCFPVAGDFKIGDKVEFEGHMLEVTLAPGLLSRNYDGLQNDLEKMDGLFPRHTPGRHRYPGQRRLRPGQPDHRQGCHHPRGEEQRPGGDHPGEGC